MSVPSHMEWSRIASIAERSVVAISVYHDGECISRGSGFIFNDEGLVFTALHVLNCGKPFTDEETAGGRLRILVKIKGRAPVEYKHGTPTLTIDCTAFSDPLLIDLAGLHPKEKWGDKLPFLVTKVRDPIVGESVLMAGFSDEVYPPFSFPSRLKKSHSGVEQLAAAREQGFDVELGLLVVKSGIVASSTKYEFSNAQSSVKGSTFFIDNGMHSGASGGPILDSDGEVFGVICERAVTRLAHEPLPNLKVPAGTTHSLTIEPLLAIRSA